MSSGQILTFIYITRLHYLRHKAIGEWIFLQLRQCFKEWIWCRCPFRKCVNHNATWNGCIIVKQCWVKTRSVSPTIHYQLFSEIGNKTHEKCPSKSPTITVTSLLLTVSYQSVKLENTALPCPSDSSTK